MLINCYKNNIITFGSNTKSRPYLELNLDNSRDKIKNMIMSVENIDNLQILITPDGGNPYASIDFYKPSFCIGMFKDISKKEINLFFKQMNNAIDLDDYIEKNYIDALFELYDYFAQKESNLDFRLTFSDKRYNFSIESMNTRKKRLEARKILEKLELKRVENEIDFIDFYQKKGEIENIDRDLEKIKNDLIKNWNIKRDEEINEDMRFNQIARITRRKFEKVKDGEIKFNEWLNEQIDK